MRFLLLFILTVCFVPLFSQELFVYTEPASNMPSRSISLRGKNMLMQPAQGSRQEYYFQPEMMWGIDKRLMVHFSGSFSNQFGSMAMDGWSSFLKYRFYSNDEVHKHFRMAFFGRASFFHSELLPLERAINLTARNSGYEAGFLFTRLKNRLALSSGISFLHALDNGRDKVFPHDYQRDALAFTLSAGRLIFPLRYQNYEQVNMNLMLECLGQFNPTADKSFVDLAPSCQFIFISKMRMDIGYRFPLYDRMERIAPKGVLLSLEYNFFSLY